MIIKITREECLCDECDIPAYVDVLNGIVYDCVHGTGFVRGTRNMIAVNLSVAAYELGLDAEEVLEDLVKAGVINPCDDDEDTYRRVSTVLDYKRRFDWCYMIDPDYYVTKIRDYYVDVSRMPVSFCVS